MTPATKLTRALGVLLSIFTLACASEDDTQAMDPSGANTGSSTGSTSGVTGASSGASTGSMTTGGSGSTGGSSGGVNGTGASNGATNGGSSGAGSGSTSGSSTGASGGSTGSSGSTGNTTGNTTGGDADAGELEHFSFFVTSLEALVKLSGSDQGFGGDLRFGETGAGAGLRGADKICTQIAEMSMKGAGAKQWRAFLSVTDDGTGKPVHAIERIGTGPWYDRLGRLLAMNLTDLANDRPKGADPAIINDFPNELGVPNHDPDGTGQVDNHDMLTGSGPKGLLYGDARSTCKDWTSAVGSDGKPRVGHSWPRQGSGVNWMSCLDEAGCAPGVSLVEMGPPNPSNPTVGSGGGYGGFYCFALTP